MSKKSGSTSELPAPEVLRKLEDSRWSYDANMSVSENWEKAVSFAPELAQGNIPLYKKSHLQKISDSIRKTAFQPPSAAKPEETPYSAYLDTKPVSAKQSGSQDAGETIFSTESISSKNLSSIGSKLSARDFAIFQAEMESTNRLLGKV